MAHTKMYEPELNEAVRIVSENILIQFDYNMTSSTEVYVVAGIEDDLSKMTEITVDGTGVTRTTLTGNSSTVMNISGLTPNTFIAVTTDEDADDDDEGIRIRVLSSNPYGSEQR